jgi:hypothetical protein
MKISFSFLTALSVSLFLIGCGPFATDNKTASTNASVGNQTNHNVSTSNQTNGSANNNTNNNGSTGNQTNGSNPTIEDCKGGGNVNGFTLPPCPDPKENDKTLLGIDSNNNGVRDDVERWIIKTYKDHHPIVTQIGFQAARAKQIVIQDPSKAKETYHIEDAAYFCNSYFENDANKYGDPILIDHSIAVSKTFKSLQLNTKERIEAYLLYDMGLSGGVYTLPVGSYKRFCDFDVDKLLGK